MTKRNHILSFLWRAAYPVAIHFLVGQVVAHIFLTVILWIGGSSKDYIAAAMTVTGIADLLVIFILLPLYFNDSCQRKAKGIIPLFTRYFPSVKDCVLLLALGAGLAEYLNMIVLTLTQWLPEDGYAEQMSQNLDGKSFIYMLLWMGIIAPAAEEILFRWLVFLRLRDRLGCIVSALLSGLAFGIYHGNISQAIYAGVLGFLFAYIFDGTGVLTSTIFLHIGANVWGVAVEYLAVYFTTDTGYTIFGVMSGFLMICVIFGLRYFFRICSRPKKGRLL